MNCLYCGRVGVVAGRLVPPRERRHRRELVALPEALHEVRVRQEGAAEGDGVERAGVDDRLGAVLAVAAVANQRALEERARVRGAEDGVLRVEAEGEAVLRGDRVGAYGPRLTPG